MQKRPENEYAAQVPEDYVRTPFGGHFRMIGIRVVHVVVELGRPADAFIPKWADRVFRVFPASGTDRDDAIRKLLAADDETRAAALTVLDLGGLRPFAECVLGKSV